MNSFVKVSYKTCKHLLRLSASSFEEFQSHIQAAFVDTKLPRTYGVYIVGESAGVQQITDSNFKEIKAQLESSAEPKKAEKLLVVKLSSFAKDAKSLRKLQQAFSQESLEGFSTSSSLYHEEAEFSAFSRKSEVSGKSFDEFLARNSSEIPCLKCYGEKLFEGKTCPKCNGSGLMGKSKKREFIQDFMKKACDLWRRETSFSFEKLSETHQRQSCIFPLETQLQPSNRSSVNSVVSDSVLWQSKSLPLENSFIPESDSLGAKNTTLKARIKSCNKDLITERPSGEFSFELEISNNGKEKWPQGIELSCVEGFFESEKTIVDSLGSGETGRVQMRLKMPDTPKDFTSSWRLRVNGLTETKYFGPRLTYNFRCEA